MKILRFFLLIVLLSLVGCNLLSPPKVVSQLTKAEATYAKCQEAERYYLAELATPLPQISELNLVSEPIMAEGKGFFWNQPNDIVLIPSEEVGAPPVTGFAQSGSYLSPRKVTCDLAEGKIRVDMQASWLLDRQKAPLVLNTFEEMWWDENADTFKGTISSSTQDNQVFSQNDSDFVFRGCNADGVDCSSIDVLIKFPLGGGSSCKDFAEANYGFTIANPDEIATCTTYIDNISYFQENPSEVLILDKDEEKILGSYIQVVNNIWLEVAYQDKSVFEYRGAGCFMQYSNNSQEDWSNLNFNQKLCSPREIVQILS